MATSTNYAGFWIRLVASLIDGFIIMAFQIVLGMVKMDFIGTIVGIVYVIGFWVYWNGQTPGKKVMKIKIIREDGKKFDIMTGVLRYVGYIISSIALFLGYFWVIWDPKKQGWHDKIAGTVVVKE